MSNLLVRPIAPQSQRLFMNRNVLKQVGDLNNRYIEEKEKTSRGVPYYNYVVNPMTASDYKGKGNNNLLYPETGLQLATTSGYKPDNLKAHYVKPTKNNKGKGIKEDLIDAQIDLNKPKRERIRKPKQPKQEPLKFETMKKGKGKIIKIPKPKQPKEEPLQFETNGKRERIRKPKQPKQEPLQFETKGKGKGKGKYMDKIKDAGKSILKNVGSSLIKTYVPELLDKGSEKMKELIKKGTDKGTEYLKDKIKDKIKGLGKDKIVGKGWTIKASDTIPAQDKLKGKGKQNKWLLFMKTKGLNPKTMPKKGTNEYDKLMKEYRK
jgi:hypothetical protein